MLTKIKPNEAKGARKMKLNNFEDYLKKRLDDNEIAQIQKQADVESKILATLQKDVSRAIDKSTHNNRFLG